MQKQGNGLQIQVKRVLMIGPGIIIRILLLNRAASLGHMNQIQEHGPHQGGVMTLGVASGVLLKVGLFMIQMAILMRGRTIVENGMVLMKVPRGQRIKALLMMEEAIVVMVGGPEMLVAQVMVDLTGEVQEMEEVAVMAEQVWPLSIHMLPKIYIPSRDGCTNI